MTPIYLDYHATTPVHPDVLSSMMPYFSEHFGNSSSQHAWGWKANMAVGKARAQVGRLFNANPESFLFTSGATESIHLAILGWLLAQENPSQCQIISTEIEHKATLGACKIAKKMGAEIYIAPVDKTGQVQIEAIQASLNKNKKTLVTVIHGHNEIGTVNDVEKIAKAIKGQAALHIDAAQSAGKIKLDLSQLPVDMLSFSGHKMYGPKGVGGLFVRDQNLIHSLFTGGGQEFNLRAGTLNVPGIVGLGVACQWSMENGEAEATRLKNLREMFFEIVGSKVHIHGHRTERLPHNISICIPGINPDVVADELVGVGFSSGSACSATVAEPNHVHKGIGLSEADSHCTFRFGLGLNTTEEHVRFLAQKILSLAAKGSPS